MNTLYHLSVFLHITFAAFWIGGMLFLPLVLLPGIKNHPDRTALLYKTGVTFRFYGWIALAGLFCTGIANAWFRGVPFTFEYWTNSRFGNLVGLKLLLFTGIIVISVVHDLMFGKKALDELSAAERARLTLLARWSGRITLLFSLAMVWLGILISR